MRKEMHDHLVRQARGRRMLRNEVYLQPTLNERVRPADRVDRTGGGKEHYAHRSAKIGTANPFLRSCDRLYLQRLAPAQHPAIFDLDHSKHMEFFQWHWWAGLAIVLFIAEIFVPGFFLVCLGIGCVGGAIMAGFGFGAAVQLTAFSVFGLIAFFTVRPLLMKRMWKGSDVLTNVDALVGQRGRVTQDFEPGLRLGRVSAAGDDWRAECTTDRALRVGDLVDVVRVESNTLIVKPVDQA